MISKPLRPGDLLQVVIQGIGSLGEGLAREQDAEIFIPKTAPGDRVEIKILQKKKGRYLAEAVRLLEPGPSRVAPACPHFERCGGCDFQHLPYEEQLAWKLRMTKHWIRRSSLAPELEKIPFDQIASPDPYHYRHRVRLQVKKGRLHYFLPHSHELFEIEKCPVLVPGFLEAIKTKASNLPDTPNWNQTFMNGTLVEGGSSYQLHNHKLGFDEQCFTQANLKVNSLLFKRIEEDMLAAPSKQSALDLYCGIGNFTFGLASHFQKVTGVESDVNGIAWAQKNTGDSQNILWLAGLSEQVLLQLEKEHAFFDFVLLDPPRQGALASCRVLVRLMPPRITYVSCHLETLVHDLILLRKGGYRITRWTVADMFPQTHHIESVVSLSR